MPGAGGRVTLTISNTGTAPYAGAVVTDSFAQMFDDAAYGGGASATAGALSYTSPVLTWTGDLAAGASAVVSFTVTVHNPDTGDKQVIITAASAAAGSSCPPGTTSGGCQLVVGVLTPALTIVKTAATASGSNAVATPGGLVTYMITVTDTGQTPYAGASLTDPLGAVLDDAAYNGDAAAVITGTGTGTGTTPGRCPTLARRCPGPGTWRWARRWPSPITVTVNNPDTGNRALANTVTSATPGSNCPASGTDARCTATVTVVGADA